MLPLVEPETADAEATLVLPVVEPETADTETADTGHPTPRPRHPWASRRSP